MPSTMNEPMAVQIRNSTEPIIAKGRYSMKMIYLNKLTMTREKSQNIFNLHYSPIRPGHSWKLVDVRTIGNFKYIRYTCTLNHTDKGTIRELKDAYIDAKNKWMIEDGVNFDLSFYSMSKRSNEYETSKFYSSFSLTNDMLCDITVRLQTDISYEPHESPEEMYLCPRSMNGRYTLSIVPDELYPDEYNVVTRYATVIREKKKVNSKLRARTFEIAKTIHTNKLEIKRAILRSMSTNPGKEKYIRIDNFDRSIKVKQLAPRNDMIEGRPDNYERNYGHKNYFYRSLREMQNCSVGTKITVLKRKDEWNGETENSNVEKHKETFEDDTWVDELDAYINEFLEK